MTGTQTLLARAALGAGGAFASIGLTGWTRLRALPAPVFDRLTLAAFAISRLGLFAAIFLLLHLAPRGDIPGFYFPQAVAVLEHRLPYRDFASSYAPLHPYADALFIVFWRSPLAIILAAIGAELLLLPVWLRLAQRLFDEGTRRTAALLYVASPISLQFVTVDGQDNVIIALMIGIALLLALRGRSFVSGLLVGLSAATVKFLPLLFVPAFFLVLPRRLRWLLGAIMSLAVVYGGAVLLRLAILQPLTAEGAMRSAGNLPYLVESLSGFTVPGRFSDAVLLAILGAVTLWIARAAHRRAELQDLRILVFGIVALTLALLLFSKKSWPPYLMLCLFPLCLLIAEESRHLRLHITLFAAFSVAAVTEHSVWASLLLQASSLEVHQLLLAGDRVAQLFVVLHAAMIAGYVWILVRALAGIRRLPVIACLGDPPADEMI